MRKIILGGLILCLTGAAGGFTGQSFAQKKKQTVTRRPVEKPINITTADAPPPPPLPKPTPTSSQLSPPPAVRSDDGYTVNPADYSNGIYNSKEGGFKIAFPGLPKRYSAPIDTAFGRATLIRYDLITNLANYGVNFFDFPTAIRDKEELKIRYDGAKNKIMETFQARLMDEKEVYFGDYYGKEFTVENDAFTVTQRIFLIEQRLFQLVVMTKGSNSKLSEKSRALNQQKVDAFFDSFAITQLPQAAAKATELPASFGVKIENSIFTSDYFRLSMPLPKDWNIVQKEETDLIMEIGKQATGNKSPSHKEQVNLSYKNTQILLMMTKKSLSSEINDAVFVMSAEKISIPNFLPEAVLEAFGKDSVVSGHAVTIPRSTQMFDGKKFAYTEFYDKTAGTKERFYVANIGGIALEILIIYKNEEDLAVMLNSLNRLKFEGGQ